MDEFRAIVSLRSQVKVEIRKLEESLKATQESLQAAHQKLVALDTVDRMLKENQHGGPVISIEPKLYKNMKQDEALQDAIRRAGKQLTAAEAAEALKRGGFPFISKEPASPVYATLKKNVKGLYTLERNGSRVVFGLAEWEKEKHEVATAAGDSAS